MPQSEILSLTERLIPTYKSADFEQLLNQFTEGKSPSIKLLVKMELNRVMAPCSKSVDLRGRTQHECQEYELDGIKHWLDDTALNSYHKNIKKFGGYTEGVWEHLILAYKAKQSSTSKGLNAESEFQVEPIRLGYDLKRLENRLKLSTQIKIILPSSEQAIHGVSLDVSASGAKFKVPAAFEYKSGDTIWVQYSDLAKRTQIAGLNKPLEYRILGVDESYGGDTIKYLRVLKLSDTDIIEKTIGELLTNNTQKTRHDNQDKILRARTRGYEHIYLKHTCNLPVFFSGNELKLALLTENNHPIWQYWHDERNQQSLSSLFNQTRMDMLTKPGVSGSSNVIYAFKHEHRDKSFFFSMMLPEATSEQRKLFWHVGARKESWKAFRLSVFELSEGERQELAKHSNELADKSSELTHYGVLQEISDFSSAKEYLLVDKPPLPTNTLNIFRHPRKIIGSPTGIYFDARSRRKEPRYNFRTPITVFHNGQPISHGATVDISKRGLNVIISTPTPIKAGEMLHIDYQELKLYDKKLPLHNVPYKLVRIGPEGQRLHLMIDENATTMKTIAFFNSIIEHNQDKLRPKEELLPSHQLLESLHNILLDKIISAPIFVNKSGPSLKPKVIGVKYPLPSHLSLLANIDLGEEISLDPIFKGHTNTLLATPMKRIDGAEPQYNEIYISVLKFGNRIQSIESKLVADFANTKERIQFIKKAQDMGDIFVLRLCGAPVFDPMTVLLRRDLDELADISMNQANALEKELSFIAGYGEIIDITEEVMIRLELTK